MLYEKHMIELGDDKIALHRFSNTTNRIPVLLLHGSIENGRIFFTKNGKGLAPFLCRNGYDVFVPDMRGKGESSPKINAQHTHSQREQIIVDIPAYIDFIQRINPFKQIHFIAHSWGGVLLLANLARTPDERVKSITFFGVKRRIGIRSLKKVLLIDMGWKTIGKCAVKKKGYFPAKDWKIGADNEPKQFYVETNDWLQNKDWICSYDQFNYSKVLSKMNLPPILSLVGSKDKVLGHYEDAKELLVEIDALDSSKLVILGKNYGNQLNYGHIDMLTSHFAPQDHFLEVVNWLRKNEEKQEQLND